jgi:hypothetical protein
MEYMPCDDGITHINIYSKGETELGRLLTNFARTPFTLPDLGRFESVEALWYYAKTGFKHEHLRGLYGVNAKKEGKKLDKVEFTEFNQLITEALKCKLRQHPKILYMLIESGEIPLTHYYYFGDRSNPKIYRLDQYDWITQVFRDVRKVCISVGYKPKLED